MQKMQMIWPDIFNNPDMDFHPDVTPHERKGAALAAQLTGWGKLHGGR